ncbi:hypothetical protein V6N12_012483 [Hibiscus sabdariffa]|uniref:Retrovirus-related Pol polyprotein from transposon TNT 1-94-like beta-barrel domain-containing protein n=1 Tax=Hibiscus sabdariffa TaxID=183260 RepID=A0ABR2A6Q7_9ROSI
MMALKYKECTSTIDHISEFQSVMNQLLEVRRRSQGSTSQFEVLVTENKGRNKEKDGNDLLVICDHNLVNLACDETSWVIDIGASIHVTSRRDFFTSYTPGDFGVLKMGNDGLVLVTSMGDVSLVSNNGTKLILKDDKHAPNIRLNLIFVEKLDDEGFSNTFSDRQ